QLMCMTVHAAALTIQEGLMAIRSVSLVLVMIALLSLFAVAQEGRNIELSGGFGYNSGNGGTSGLNIGAAYWFTRKVAFAFDYDLGWDVTRIGVLETTSVGLATADNRLQNVLFGPRINIGGLFDSPRIKGNALLPFAELQIGFSSLDSTINIQNIGEQSSSDTAFTWMFGGGTDIKLSPHWVGRLKVDLLRTHFASSGQSHVRIGMGVAYTFGERR
ncbi:MAG: outer membrane beta-barrel protein, partial [Candidatus Korobacteraceae bacterium]